MYVDTLGMVNCDSLKAQLTKQLFTMVTYKHCQGRAGPGSIMATPRVLL